MDEKILLKIYQSVNSGEAVITEESGSGPRKKVQLWQYGVMVEY
jgi:hypothetical protein